MRSAELREAVVRRLAQGLACALLLLFLLWLSSPWWSFSLARLVATQAGIELAGFESRRPSLDGIHVERLRARLAAIELELEGARVRWTWAGLRLGRLASVDIDRIVVRQAGETELTGASATRLDSNVIPRLPVDRLVVDDLVFHAPRLPLRMQGDFRLDARVIHLRLTSTESPAGIPVDLTVRLDDQGRFLARLHSSEDKDVNALEARGAMANGVLDIAGTLDLRDYELRLITGLTGITPMGGRLTGPVRATFDEHFNLRRGEVLPVVSLQAESEQGRMRRFSLEGRIAWDSADDGVGVVAVALTDTSVSRATAVEADVRLGSGRIDAHATFSLSRSDFSSLMALLDLTDIEGGGHGEVRLSAPLPFALDSADSAATVSLDLRYGKTVALRLESLGLVHEPGQSWSFNASGIDLRQDDEGIVTRLVASALSGEFSGADMSSVRFTIRGDASRDGDHLHLVASSLDVTGTANRLESGWSMQCSFSAAGIEYRQDDEGVVTRFVASAFSGEFSDAGSPSVRFTMRGDASRDEDDLHLLARSLDVTGTASRIESGWNMRIDVGWRNQRLVLAIDADAGFDDLAFNAPIDWQLREPLLARMLGMKTDYDVVAGHFTGMLTGSIRGDETRARVQGTFNQGRLVYGDNEARDVSATVNYLLSPDGRYTAALDDVRIGAFDPGVPITEIHTSLRFDDRTVNVGNSSAQMLGGMVTTSPFDYTVDAGDAAFDVVIRSIDLGAVLALEGEDLDGTGILEGRLPIQMEAGTVTVRDGTIRSVGTGVIRVKPGITRALNQPGLDFALRALEDFSYTSLDADIDYGAEGDLVAAIRLKGRNPAIEKGRPIHYNLNVTENIPSLLASLRVQDDVNERIERRVREGFRPGAQSGTGEGASE